MGNDSYYAPMVWTSFSITIWIIFLVLMILSSLIRRRGERISPRIIYFYTMSFVSLIFVAEGLAVFIKMIADLIVVSGNFNLDIKKAFLMCFSLLAVSIPSYVFHWGRCLKGIGTDEEEKMIWLYYKYMVLGLAAIASLAFVGNLCYQILSSILDIAKFDWNILDTLLGYGVVGISVWIYHWSPKMRFSE